MRQQQHGAAFRTATGQTTDDVVRVDARFAGGRFQRYREVQQLGRKVRCRCQGLERRQIKRPASQGALQPFGGNIGLKVPAQLLGCQGIARPAAPGANLVERAIAVQHGHHRGSPSL